MSITDSLYAWQYRSRLKYVNWLYRNRLSQVSLTAEPQKVLIVLAGLLGDSVMSVPTIISARQIWRDSHITLLGKKHNYELLAACPLIDDFKICQADPFSLRKNREIKQLEEWLRAENFDLAMILLGDQFAHLLAKAKIPVRVGVKGVELEPCLTHTYEIGSPRTWGPAERLNAIRSLGYSVDKILPQLWVEDSARQTAGQKLETLGLNSLEKYVVAHPFGSTRRQWWDINKVAEVARHLRSEFNLQTILIGSGKETVSAVTEAVKKEVVDTTGQLSLPELLAVIDEAAFVVTTDSGPFHIAGALKKQIIGLFRARRPEHAAQYPTATVVFGQYEQCENSCRWDYCSSNPCNQLTRISGNEVINLINKRFGIKAVV